MQKSFGRLRVGPGRTGLRLGVCTGLTSVGAIASFAESPIWKYGRSVLTNSEAETSRDITNYWFYGKSVILHQL